MIVALAGKAGSGKDTVAGLLKTQWGFTPIAFADVMKRQAAELWGFTKQQLWGPSEFRNEVDSRWGLSPRRVLQHMGTEFGRGLHQDVWVRFALGIASTLDGPDGHRYTYSPSRGLSPRTSYVARSGVVITDVRFPNEMKAIRDAGGLTVRVLRNGSGLYGDAGQHRSERALDWVPDDAFSAVIRNNGTMGDLETAVARCMERLSAAA